MIPRIQLGLAAELPCTDLATPERVGNLFDSGQVGGKSPTHARTQSPPAEEFDFNKGQPVVPQYRLHLGDVHACGNRAGQVGGVQADAGEPGGSSSFAPLDERIRWRFAETRTREREETRDQTWKLHELFSLSPRRRDVWAASS